jgi:hypothetical protein
MFNEIFKYKYKKNKYRNSNQILNFGNTILYIFLFLFGVYIIFIAYNKWYYTDILNKPNTRINTRFKNDIDNNIDNNIDTFVINSNNKGKKGIIKINRDKLYENPKTVSFSLNNDVVYFNETGFLRREQERM